MFLNLIKIKNHVYSCITENFSQRIFIYENNLLISNYEILNNNIKWLK